MNTLSNELGFPFVVPANYVSEEQFEHNMAQIPECLHKYAESKQEEMSLMMKRTHQELEVELQRCKRDLRLMEKQISQENKKGELQSTMVERLHEDSKNASVSFHQINY